jgi:hypothetical protein
LYISPNIIRVIKSRSIERVVSCSMHGERKMYIKLFFGKPEGNRPLGRPRHRWKDNMIVGKYGGKVWTGCIWNSIWTSGVFW